MAENFIKRFRAVRLADDPAKQKEQVEFMFSELERISENKFLVDEQNDNGGGAVVLEPPRYLTAHLSANQTTNVSVDNHIEFNTTSSDSGDITLSTGTGQQNGIFTVPAGTWGIFPTVRMTGSSGTVFQVRDDSDDSPIDHGRVIHTISQNASTNETVAPSQALILNNENPVDIKVDIITATGQAVLSNATSIAILEIGARIQS